MSNHVIHLKFCYLYQISAIHDTIHVIHVPIHVIHVPIHVIHVKIHVHWSLNMSLKAFLKKSGGWVGWWAGQKVLLRPPKAKIMPLILFHNG
jgi:hypothetical protein